MDARIVQEPGRHLAVTSFEADLAAMAEKMGEAFGTVAAHLARAGVPPTGPVLAYYEIRPEGMTVLAGFAVDAPVPEGDAVHPFQLPRREVLQAVHVGSYDTLPTTYAALRTKAEELGRTLDETAMWEEYESSPDTPPDQTRTTISWPLLPA